MQTYSETAYTLGQIGVRSHRLVQHAFFSLNLSFFQFREFLGLFIVFSAVSKRVGPIIKSSNAQRGHQADG